MIKFGIYTSFYNCSRFIEQIFSNIEEINYENFEWHIVDDFSDKDNTRDLILDRLSRSPIKEKIRFFEQDYKKQMYWKPNYFFDDSFDWIILVDCDDLIHKNSLMVYDSVLKEVKDQEIFLLSSDFHKIEEKSGNLHSISYLDHGERISKKIDKFHPTVDYLNNLNYYCFGNLRAFKNDPALNFEIDFVDAGAEDSYHVFWCNSNGKYLNVPRSLYRWHYREDSESHSTYHNPNFNGNFEMSLKKLEESDRGCSTEFRSVFKETSTLICHDFFYTVENDVSLFTRDLSYDEKVLIEALYPEFRLSFNDGFSGINFVCLNSFTPHSLKSILEGADRNRKYILYYQNDKKCFNDEQRDEVLNKAIEEFGPVIIDKLGGYTYWRYIRHLVIKVNL